MTGIEEAVQAEFLFEVQRLESVSIKNNDRTRKVLCSWHSYIGESSCIGICQLLIIVIPSSFVISRRWVSSPSTSSSSGNVPRWSSIRKSLRREVFLLLGAPHLMGHCDGWLHWVFLGKVDYFSSPCMGNSSCSHFKSHLSC